MGNICKHLITRLKSISTPPSLEECLKNEIYYWENRERLIFKENLEGLSVIIENQKIVKHSNSLNAYTTKVGCEKQGCMVGIYRITVGNILDIDYDLDIKNVMWYLERRFGSDFESLNGGNEIEVGRKYLAIINGKKHTMTISKKNGPSEYDKRCSKNKIAQLKNRLAYNTIIESLIADKKYCGKFIAFSIGNDEPKQIWNRNLDDLVKVVSNRLDEVQDYVFDKDEGAFITFVSRDTNIVKKELYFKY